MLRVRIPELLEGWLTPVVVVIGIFVVSVLSSTAGQRWIIGLQTPLIFALLVWGGWHAVRVRQGMPTRRRVRREYEKIRQELKPRS